MHTAIAAITAVNLGGLFAKRESYPHFICHCESCASDFKSCSAFAWAAFRLNLEYSDWGVEKHRLAVGKDISENSVHNSDW